jgi:phosphoribosylformylglycinamidine synthase
MSRTGPRIAVVTFPGSNDDGDARLALDLLGADAVPVWHTDTELPPGTGGIVLPGGFSYGDYLRCGAIARVAPVMDAVRRFADDGGPVLGICNGFQILCEAGLLPGVLRANRQLEFVCADVTLVVETTETPFTAHTRVGDELVIPIKHGEGCWVADDELFARVTDHGQVVLRYADDVNGARDRVAGVCNEDRNVLGLMPHPEHAVDPLLGPTGGIPILQGLIAASSAPVAPTPVGAG